MPENAPFIDIVEKKGSFSLHLKCDSVGFFSALLFVIDKENHDFCFITVSASVRTDAPNHALVHLQPRGAVHRPAHVAPSTASATLFQRRTDHALHALAKGSLVAAGARSRHSNRGRRVQRGRRDGERRVRTDERREHGSVGDPVPPAAGASRHQFHRHGDQSEDEVAVTAALADDA